MTLQDILNRLEARAMQVGTAIARQMFSYWKAASDARNAQQQAAQQPAQSPFIVDLDQEDYEYNEDEL